MPDLKLLEDLIALARTGSFVRAAEARHVTHPAFGRRIRALETWAGTPLVYRGQQPATLTPEGETLLKTALQVVENMSVARNRMRGSLAGGDAVLRIATGRSLARTLVTDWIARLRHRAPKVLTAGTRVELSTGRMEDLTTRLEHGKVDVLCCYEHPAMSVALSPQRYRYITFATDKLVPVCQVDLRGNPRHALREGGHPTPLIDYAGGLAMARILGDRLETTPYALSPFMRTDSLDAALTAVTNGLGVAWLPWSLVVGQCRRGALTALGGRGDEVAFEVRLYRPRARMSELAEAAWAATARRLP
ncbi:LysR family transcriptional regulator [Bordetella genomosp. 8]|uniref:LysR family transcriptional regulator n=1 Tax=Bordetella genomosp. 8 TaxID=1416806 RepID=A0A1W6YJH5_9BORD|nr:LysR family transcriptional regulator [Bordetella genomosp. 8]ARP81245.1 LysR family transcriptional regulator [Bordetella genomosp. 8]